jgi:cytoskeletal protein RodZ
MIGFRNNKILFGSENLGERFRVARIGANIKIEDAAEELSINPRYLRALES